MTTWSEARTGRHDRAGSILDLMPVLKRQRPLLLATVLSAICAQGFFLATLAIAAELAGRVATGDAPGRFLVWLALLALVVLATGAARWWQSYISHAFAFSALKTLQMGVFDGLERAAPFRVLGSHTGELASVALNDVALMEHFYAHTLADYCAAVLVPGLAVVALFALEPTIGAALLVFMLVVASVPYWMSRRAQRQGAETIGHLGSLHAETVEFILAQRELAMFGRAEDYLRRLMRRTENVTAAQQRYGSRAGLEQAMIEGLTGLAVLLCAVLAVRHLGDGSLDASRLPLIVVLAGGALVPVVEVSQTARKLGELQAASRRILAILRQPPRVADTGKVAAPRAGDIRFEAVGFAHDRDRGNVLAGFDLTIDRGSMVALAGRSGAGKSTVFHLLMRFLDVDAGRILIGGVDIRSMPINVLRSLIAYVPQDAHIFNDTIAGNVRLGRPEASEDEVEEACRLAQADAFIAALPDGYQTMCGEDGTRLSGGQRQRLAIARALLTRAPIILFDEASAHLDAESERALDRAIASIREGRTIIVIAHRPATLRRADRIVLLDNGEIVESGPHAALIALGGSYATMIGERAEAE